MNWKNISKQQNNFVAAKDSNDDTTPPSQLLCPKIRTQNMDCHFPSLHIGNDSYPMINNSCYLSDAREKDKESLEFLRLNLPMLFNHREDRQYDFVHCEACSQNTIGTIYYYCNGCKQRYHKECVKSPAILVSPYHPKYPLQLLYDLNKNNKKECHSCGKSSNNLVYYSSMCDLILHPVCANKREFPVINNHKKHQHTLHYFPRKASLTCDVCGTDDNTICFYICHQCNFVVHIMCIDVPRVIHISRHSHRLFFTSSLSSTILSCWICHQKIDGNYGEFSCTKGCDYVVHCKCATRSDVWDGKELEDEPEKVYDYGKPWKKMGDGIIQHFSHPHHNMMRFDEDIDELYYEKNQCEACLLPLYSGSIYKCRQCDFVLHESCANLPRVQENMVHVHALILRPNNSESVFVCKSCHRYSNGFRYDCHESCNDSFDVRCASLSEPVQHKSHPDPLFLVCTRPAKQPCSICGELSYLLLDCVNCVFALCFSCATLPYKVKHEDDEHVLTLSYDKAAICQYWCQACEENIDPKKGYYICSEYGTTFHIQCKLGNDPYMKVGQLTIFSEKIDIISNNRLIRPICNHCQRYCQYKIVFRKDGKIFCSYSEIADNHMTRYIKYAKFELVIVTL